MKKEYITLTDEELVGWLWHEVVEDKLGFVFGVRVIKMNLNIKLTPQDAEMRFLNYFKQRTGIEPFTKCPCCQGQLVPRKSRYGYFVGCSTFPKCKFKATGRNAFQKPKSN